MQPATMLPQQQLVNEYHRLKASVMYNHTMHVHYQALFNTYRYTWQFGKATYAFIKMVHFEKQWCQAKLNDLLNQLNQTSHVQITIE